MISITLCDDCVSALDGIQKELIRVSTRLNTKFEIHSFSSGKELLRNLQSSLYISDIFILDIDMPEMNGLELAKYIRRENPSAIIIFLTAHPEYATEGYKVNAIRYINKRHIQEQLPEAIDYAITQYQLLQNRYIIVTHYRDCYHVRLNDILYVERVGRQLIIHTNSKAPIVDTRGIHELFDLIHDSKFIFIERGCFINTDYVYKVVDRSVHLTNGEILIISRRLIADVKKLITSVWNSSE